VSSTIILTNSISSSTNCPSEAAASSGCPNRVRKKRPPPGPGRGVVLANLLLDRAMLAPFRSGDSWLLRRFPCALSPVVAHVGRHRTDAPQGRRKGAVCATRRRSRFPATIHARMLPARTRLRRGRSGFATSRQCNGGSQDRSHELLTAGPRSAARGIPRGAGHAGRRTRSNARRLWTKRRRAGGGGFPAGARRTTTDLIRIRPATVVAGTMPGLRVAQRMRGSGEIARIAAGCLQAESRPSP